ncbi:MAG TPA: hypothetical protein VMP01_16080 [Pirellulaceae bacterium]|nr:hypothetical protein [Pirellulaceae bacterium]
MTAPHDSPPVRKSWLRFSLASLFLLTALICVTTAYLLQRRELNRKDAEIRQYRIDLGLLDDRPGVLVVDDPSKVYVAALPSFEPLRYRWRVYVPPGKQWMLQLRRGEFTDDEVRGSGAGTDLKVSGEFLLELAVQRNLEGQVEIVARCGTQGLIGGVLDDRLIKALKNQRQATRKLTGSPKQESFESEGIVPLVTWKSRPTGTAAAEGDSGEPLEMGFSFFLEEGSVLMPRAMPKSKISSQSN